MKFAYDLAGGQQIVRRLPLYGGGTDIQPGAAVMRGATAATDQGYGIVAASTIAGFLGVTESLLNADTLDNDPAVGTKYIRTPVTINPLAVYSADYSQTTGLTIASISNGVPTVTSLEAIDGGWLLAVSGPGQGNLGYVKSVTTGAATMKTLSSAMPTTWTTSTKVIKIMPLWSLKLDLSTDGTKIKDTTAAQGSGLCDTLDNYVNAPGFDNVQLDPTKHDGVAFGTSNVRFFAYILFTTRHAD